MTLGLITMLAGVLVLLLALLRVVIKDNHIKKMLRNKREHHAV